MRTKCSSRHTKAGRVRQKGRNENGHQIESDCSDITSCQFKEVKEYGNLACRHILEEKLTYQPETKKLLYLHSHSCDSKTEQECGAQQKTGHQHHIREQQKDTESVIEMEGESQDEADCESSCGEIETVFIKEEVLEGEGTDEEMVSSTVDSTDSDTVHRTIETVYIKEENAQPETNKEASACHTHLDKPVRVKRPRKRKIYHKSETEEERELRLSKQRSYYFKRRVNETSAEREERLRKIRENAKKRRLKESDEERAVRLKEKRTYETRRLGTESAEKRALRLEKQRLYQAHRVRRETPEERAQRLKNKRLSYQRRRSNTK